MTQEREVPEWAREAARSIHDLHCRYCNWVGDEGPYAQVMKCKDDYEAIARALVEAYERGRAEGMTEEAFNCAAHAEAAYKKGYGEGAAGLPETNGLAASFPYQEGEPKP